MSESGVTYSIETVDMREYAQQTIDTARDQGVDPWEIYMGVLKHARHIKMILEAENE